MGARTAGAAETQHREALAPQLGPYLWQHAVLKQPFWEAAQTNEPWMSGTAGPANLRL